MHEPYHFLRRPPFLPQSVKSRHPSSLFCKTSNFLSNFFYKILSAKNAQELPRTRELFPVLLLPKTRHVFLLFLKLCSSKELPGELKMKIVRLPPEAVSGVDAGLHMTPCLFETQHQRARCTHAMPFQAHEKVGKQYLLIARWLMDW